MAASIASTTNDSLGTVADGSGLHDFHLLGTSSSISSTTNYSLEPVAVGSRLHCYIVTLFTTGKFRISFLIDFIRGPWFAASQRLPAWHYHVGHDYRPLSATSSPVGPAGPAQQYSTLFPLTLPAHPTKTSSSSFIGEHIGTHHLQASSASYIVIAPEGEDIEQPNTSACQPSKPTSTQTNPRQLSNLSSPPQPNVDAITNTNVRKSGRIREVVGKPDYNEIDSADDMVVVISYTVREKARLRQQQCRA
eukprot:gene29193-31085_t